MSIKENLEIIRENIKNAAIECGRSPEDITLVAVSKRKPVSSIIEAYEAGQRHFGENYAQELRDKANELAHLKDIKWHYIGNLQRNKVKYVAKVAQVMECIDSLKIGKEFSKIALKNNRTVDVFLQVNIGGEEQKSGCTVEEANELAHALSEEKGIVLSGLMTMTPFNTEASITRKYFKALYNLKQNMDKDLNLKELSIGMSGDYQEAIQEGSTVVRVGTSIFGGR